LVSLQLMPSIPPRPLRQDARHGFWLRPSPSEVTCDWPRKRYSLYIAESFPRNLCPREAC
jgi:hypothetical protein